MILLTVPSFTIILESLQVKINKIKNIKIKQILQQKCILDTLIIKDLHFLEGKMSNQQKIPRGKVSNK